MIFAGFLLGVSLFSIPPVTTFECLVVACVPPCLAPRRNVFGLESKLDKVRDKVRDKGNQIQARNVNVIFERLLILRLDLSP